MSELPERIGHYRIESALGRGGMGEVFLAWDERLRRRVALKRLRADVADSPASRERFRREASTAAELSHPSAVHVYDLVEETDGDYLVMEYVPGDSLRHRLARGPLSVIETLRFGRQIAEGLAAAHGAGLIHRDLKADNVILTEKGEAKILDFGLARHICPLPDETSLTQRGFVVGTYHAMSPEQATGGPVDERSDLFSLGSLLAEMLTGKPLFKADTPAATLRRVLAETPPPLATVRSDVPEALSSLISRLLAKDPADRPGSAEQVARALREIAMDFQGDSAALGPTVSELPTSWDHPGMAKPKPRSRRRWWVYGAVGVVGVGVAFGIWKFQRPVTAENEEAQPKGVSALVRVLVARPSLRPPEDSALRLAATCALSQAFSELRRLRGTELETVEPPGYGEGGEEPSILETAREVLADEVLVLGLTALPQGRAQVAVTRFKANGELIYASGESRPLSVEAKELARFADEVSRAIRRAYQSFDRMPWSGDSKIAARPEDYAAFLRVRQRLDEGQQVDLRSDLNILTGILRGSPEFLPARLLAADFCLTLFGSEGDSSYLDQARNLIASAHSPVAADPQLLQLRFKLALAEERLNAARGFLRELEELLGQGTKVRILRADLAEAQGNFDLALRELRLATQESPSWRSFHRYARLAGKTGKLEEARGALKEAIRRWPKVIWILETQADFELQYGSAERAQSQYQALRDRSKSALVNLGLSLFLQERHKEAVDVYFEALNEKAVDPGVLVNLADAEYELDMNDHADLHCKQVVEELRTTKTPTGQMARAQCLARLSRDLEALKIVRETLKEEPDDPFVSYTAAMVRALASDTKTAVVDAIAALEDGLAEHWFQIPALKPVWDDPDFQAALRERRKQRSPALDPTHSP